MAILVVGFKAIGKESATQSQIEIQFNNRKFIPASVQVAAGVPLVINVRNSSKERIEFESFKLGRERVVEPGQSITLRLPPLRPGKYDFYDDFHDDVPEGVIVVR